MIEGGSKIAAWRRPIDKGVVPNNAGRHINDLAICQGDVLSADRQPATPVINLGGTPR